jgi:hypothetical protein
VKFFFLFHSLFSSCTCGVLLQIFFFVSEIAITLSFDVQVLKETLVRHGFVFESDTDTEVIPKLAKFVYDSLTAEIESNGGKFSSYPQELYC